MMQRLAYIDDCESNLDYMGLVLQNEFALETFQDPKAFFEKFNHSEFNVILVDVHMPIMDGFAVYEELIKNKNYNGCPVIFISSDDSSATRIKSFSLGAVDFLDRKMKPHEMLVRIKAKVEFFKKHSNIVEFENIKLNLNLLRAYLAGEELKLTFTEFKLLYLLVKNYPEPAIKEDLVEAVWADEHVQDATIYTHTFNLNTKLEKWNFEVNKKAKGLVLTKKAGAK